MGAALASFAAWVVETVLGWVFKSKPAPLDPALAVQARMAQDAVDRTSPGDVSGKLREHEF